MSEYQYYEFQAIDRPLSPTEMAKVRSYSTRARITSTSFVNEYEWGDFKGNTDAWMARYYDAFLYLANWGTHIFKLRVPARLLDPEVVEPCCDGEAMALKRAGENIVLTFNSESEDPEWEESEEQLASLLPVRAELMRGDHCAIYLGWLLSITEGSHERDELEPLVPPGLGRLSPALARFVAFLRIDPDLIAAAAENSAAREIKAPDAAALVAWLGRRAAAEKDAWLARLLLQDEPALPAELMQRFLRARVSERGTDASAPARRTVGALLDAASLRRDRRLARAREAERVSQQKEGPRIWREVEALTASSSYSKYSRAVRLLQELRDRSAACGDASFAPALAAFRAARARKSTLLKQLDQAGL